MLVLLYLGSRVKAQEDCKGVVLTSAKLFDKNHLGRQQQGKDPRVPRPISFCNTQGYLPLCLCYFRGHFLIFNTLRLKMQVRKIPKMTPICTQGCRLHLGLQLPTSPDVTPNVVTPRLAPSHLSYSREVSSGCGCTGAGRSQTPESAQFPVPSGQPPARSLEE